MNRINVLFAFVAVALSGSTKADVIYDMGAIQRPVRVTNLNVNGIMYDVEMRYDNDGDNDPFRVGDLPDDDIPLARVAMQSALNSTSINSSLTILFFQPNFPKFPTPGVGFFQSHGYVLDGSAPAGNWTVNTNLTNFDVAGWKGDYAGFTQFTVAALPEPNALILGLLAAASAIFLRRRQQL